MHASEPPAGLLEKARRLGPLPYSWLGPNPAPELPSSADIAGWELDAVDAWWAELGRPDPFTFVEIGAGDGSRAASLLGAGPGCLTALRYVLVEDDPGCLQRHRAHLSIESPIFVLGPVDAGGDEDDDEGRPRAGIGPLVTSLSEAPAVDGAAVVIAVGWASRLPSDRLEWRDGAWWEVRLAAGAEGGLTELLVPIDDGRTVTAPALTRGASRPEGARYAQLGPAVDWLGQALGVADEGRLAVIDRWAPVTGPLAAGEVPPLALDQLAAVRRPVEPAPVELFSGLSVVTWRLG